MPTVAPRWWPLTSRHRKYPARWDVSDPQRAPQVAEKAAAEFGRIDALIAIAGIFPLQKVEEITVDDWH